MKLSPSLIIVIFLVVGIILGRSLFPRTIDTSRNIPVIVTKFDTVKVKWTDTVKIDHFTTDTFNLVIHQTIHDTTVINVSSDTSSRPKLWPILSFGYLTKDTANVRTFDLRTGRGASSVIYTPGPVDAIVADSFPTPHMTFGTYPTNNVSLVKKLLYGTVGYGLCSISNLVRR